MSELDKNSSNNKEYSLFCFLAANFLAFQIGKLPVYNFVKLNELNKNNNNINWMEHIKKELNFTLSDKLIIDTLQTQNNEEKLQSFILEKYGKQIYNLFETIIE
jgi:hypothetical protein